MKLEQKYDKKNSKWIFLILLILIFLSTLAFKLKKKASSDFVKKEDLANFSVPNEITPFSVLGLLRKIHKEKDFAKDIQLQLNESIASVEKVYFDRENQQTLNLKDIAEEWVNRAV